MWSVPLMRKRFPQPRTIARVALPALLSVNLVGIALASVLDSGTDVAEHCHDHYAHATTQETQCIRDLCHIRATAQLAQECRDKAYAADPVAVP